MRTLPEKEVAIFDEDGHIKDLNSKSEGQLQLELYDSWRSQGIDT